MTTKLNIKQWDEADRPREKMLSQGMTALSDAELLAILIGSGNTEESAVELSRRILAACSNNLNELARLPIGELCKRFKGIGAAKAVTIAAALELGRRRKWANEPEHPLINSPKAAFEQISPLLGDLQHEEMWVLLLNRRLQLISAEKIGQGGLAHVTCDARQVVKLALDKNASALILAHNHPSGNDQPSQADHDLTQRVREACRLFDISCNDHIIVAHRRFYSFADHGDF